MGQGRKAHRCDCGQGFRRISRKRRRGSLPHAKDFLLRSFSYSSKGSSFIRNRSKATGGMILMGSFVLTGYMDGIMPFCISHLANPGERGISTRNFTGQTPPFRHQPSRQQIARLLQCLQSQGRDKPSGYPLLFPPQPEGQAGGKQEIAAPECMVFLCRPAGQQ